MSETKTIQQIKEEIAKYSPHPDQVKLLAVSKKQSLEKIQSVIAQKHRLFGENYVQEALEKIQLLPKTIDWHLIGHLQSKKVKSIIGKFAYIHSVDSLKLAELISEKSKVQGLVQNIFIEVNLGNEDSKTGFSISSLNECWSQLVTLENVRLCGLMSLPPPSEDPVTTRSYFRALKSVQEVLKKTTDTRRHPMDELSMGTSQDYVLALEEGSTFIRIGTILFGERS